MSFFEQLSAIIGEGYQISLNVQMTKGKMSVSVLPKSLKEKDELSKKNLAPVVATGTPAQIDAGLIAAIVNPIREINEIVVNKDSFIDEKKKTKTPAKKAGTPKPTKSEPATPEPEKAEQLELEPEMFDEETGEVLATTEEDEPIAAEQPAANQDDEQSEMFNDDDWG